MMRNVDWGQKRMNLCSSRNGLWNKNITQHHVEASNKVRLLSLAQSC